MKRSLVVLFATAAILGNCCPAKADFIFTTLEGETNCWVQEFDEIVVLAHGVGPGQEDDPGSVHVPFLSFRGGFLRVLAKAEG